MATRMQQRRGTAEQWTTSNPILNVGEIGYESDTNKFKIGDDTNHWEDLPYFLDEDSIGTSLDGYIPDSLLGAANGVAQLNSSGKLVSDQIPNVDEITQDAINTALVAGTGLDKTYDDNANTITIDIDSTVATKTYVDDAVAAVDLSSKQDVVSGVSSTEIGYLDGVTSAIQTQINDKAPIASPTFTGTVAGITSTMVGLGNVDNTSDANKPVSTATQTALDDKAPLASPALTGTPTAPTATAGTNSTQVATTAYADAAVAALVDSAPGALNTLNELAAAINDDASYASTITSALGDKAPLDSPTFTGTVDFTGATVNGISSYSAPTLGSTSIASGATVTTISGLTDIVLNGPGSVADELTLILMGAL